MTNRRIKSVLAMSIALLPAVLLVLLLGGATPARAAGTVGTGNPASCDDAALNTAMAGGGLVMFNCGPGPVTISIALKTLTNGSTTIDGGLGQITLDGGNTNQLFIVTGTATLILKNLTLAHGFHNSGDGYGGAIANYAALAIDNSLLQSNSSSNKGGAIYNAGIVTVTNSTFYTNTSYQGAGLLNWYGQATISNTTFRSNAGGSGAGVLGFGGALALTNVSFMTNTASSAGGGLANYVGALILTNVSFMTNTASLDGGGLFNVAGALTATNVSFTANTSFAGGGLENSDWSVATLTNATFTGNHAQDGGAIFNSINSTTPPPLLITGSTFSDNTAHVNGGAIDNVGPLVVANSTFISNSAGSDGGALFSLVRVVSITNSSFISNSATYGGAIENNGIGAQMTLVDTSLRANRAYTTAGGGQGNGGGLDNSNLGQATLINVTLSNNYAALGGGIENDHAQIALTNSTLSGNSAQLYAGGIDNFHGSASLSFVTLDGNSSPIGAGVYQVGIAADQGMTLTDTIVAHGASGGNCLVPSGTVSITSNNYNLSDDSSCNAFFTQPNDQKNVPAKLGLLGNHGGFTLTHVPAADSPAVDHGGLVCPATDQRGVTRPQDAACDIGAVERQASDGGATVYLYLPLTMK